MCATKSRSNDQLHPPGGGCRQFGAAAPFWCPPGKSVSTSAAPKVRRVPSRRANSVAQRARRYTAAPRPAPFIHSTAGSQQAAPTARSGLRHPALSAPFSPLPVLLTRPFIYIPAPAVPAKKSGTAPARPQNISSAASLPLAPPTGWRPKVLLQPPNVGHQHLQGHTGDKAHHQPRHRQHRQVVKGGGGL